MELRLDLFAVRYVPNDADHEALAALHDRAEADLDRELAAVLSFPEKLEAGAHGPGSRRRRVLLAMSNVGGVEPLGQQNLNRLSDEVAPLIAEHALGLAIHDADAARRVHDNDGVRRPLEECPKPRLGGVRAVAIRRRVRVSVRWLFPAHHEVVTLGRSWPMGSGVAGDSGINLAGSPRPARNPRWCGPPE